jgi:hypothetical protein
MQAAAVQEDQREIRHRRAGPFEVMDARRIQAVSADDHSFGRKNQARWIDTALLGCRH